MARGKILIVCREASAGGARLEPWLKEAGWETTVLWASDPSSRKVFHAQNPDILIVEPHLLIGGDFLPGDSLTALVVLVDPTGNESFLSQADWPQVQAFLDASWPQVWVLRALEAVAHGHRIRRAELEESAGVKSLLSRCPGLIYRCPSYPDSLPVYVGGAAAGITGFTPEEFLKGTATLGQLILEDDRRMVANTLYLRISRKLAYEMEYRIRDREGRVRWIRDSGAGIFTYDGVLKYAEGYWMDITEVRMMG